MDEESLYSAVMSKEEMDTKRRIIRKKPINRKKPKPAVNNNQNNMK